MKVYTLSLEILKLFSDYGLKNFFFWEKTQEKVSQDEFCAELKINILTSIDRNLIKIPGLSPKVYPLTSTSQIPFYP